MFRQDAGGYRGTKPDSTRACRAAVSRWEIDFWFMEHGKANGLEMEHGCCKGSRAAIVITAY